MAKAKLFNANGEHIKDIELEDNIFAVKPKKDVVHQVYVALNANKRLPWADTKDRSEVRGGGKKPWKQKGTGRARHGSIRSPIWKGGGVTFGPLSNRDYTQKINKKMAKLAVKMCLSDKVMDGKMIVLDNLTTNGKTKQFAEIMSKLPNSGRTALVVSAAKDEALMKAAKNLREIQVKRASDVNVLDLINNQYIVTTEDGIKSFEGRLK